MRKFWLKILSIPFPPETQHLPVKRRWPEVTRWDSTVLTQGAEFETVQIHAEKEHKVPSGQRIWWKQSAVLGNVAKLNNLNGNCHLNLKSHAHSLAGIQSLIINLAWRWLQLGPPFTIYLRVLHLSKNFMSLCLLWGVHTFTFFLWLWTFFDLGLCPSHLHGPLRLKTLLCSEELVKTSL